MRKLLVLSLTVIALLAVSSVAFAADEAARIDSAGLGLVALGAALGMGIAALGCGIGMGVGLKGACEGTARNPEVGGKITVTMILGFAFIESLAIYTLVIDMILLYANPFM